MTLPSSADAAQHPTTTVAPTRRTSRASGNGSGSGSGSGARLVWADLVRGAAILGVVYFHSTLFLSDVGIDHTLGRAKAVFELFPIPAFFLIAGMFAARGVTEWSLRTLAVKRILPLLYVYVLWSLLRFAMFALFPALPARDTDVAANDPMSLLLLPVFPASMYWFLYALALFFVVAWLVRSAPRWLVVGAAAVLSAAFTSGLIDTGTIAWNRIGALVLFFVLGVFYSREIQDAVNRSRPSHRVLVILAFVAVAGALAVFRSLIAVPFLVTLGQLLAVAVACVIARSLPVSTPGVGFVGAAGRTSLPIYLVHLFAIAPLAWAIGLLDPSWPAPVNIAVALSVTAAAVALGFGLARLGTVAPWLLVPVLRVPAPRR